MNGVLPVDKPEGPTSHDVVAAARRALRTRRIGHTGTLDPFATGLLLLCIGPATRLAEYLTGLDKRYEATARLGTTTDTLDATGVVTATTDGWRDLAAEEIRAAFGAERGVRLQRPPAYSAKRVGGRRAYDLAREGQEVAPEPVEVVIRSLDVLGIDGPDVRFALECSSGTYVRAVARDAGERLGVGAHLTQLRRTRIGPFDVAGALPVDRLEDGAAVAEGLLTPLAALPHLPVVELDAESAARVRHGQRLPAAALGRADGAESARTPDGLVALALDGALVAVAEARDGALRPRKVFA